MSEITPYFKIIVMHHIRTTATALSVEMREYVKNSLTISKCLKLFYELYIPINKFRNLDKCS
jgi:hypothetical protein